MKTSTVLILVTTLCVPCFAGADSLLPRIQSSPSPDTTLLARPVPRNSLPPKIQARFLRADYEAAASRLAQLEARIKELSDERDRLLERQTEITAQLKDVEQAPTKAAAPAR